MAALAGYEQPHIPDQSEAAKVIETNPDIKAMVEKIAGHAASYFGWITVALDTRQYDEWDPPLRMTITVPFTDEKKWAHQYGEFVTWLATLEDFNLDRLQVMLLSRKFPESHT
jgi:hypothetical protein